MFARVTTERDASIKLIARNKRASFDYELGERFEAGLVLSGSEVKALRDSPADLTDSYCVVERNEAFLHGMNIPERRGHVAFGHVAKRPRKLLLHAVEIEEIKRAIERDGMTVVATRIYFKDGRAKVEIALARGRKKADRRQAIREKDADKEARAAVAKVLRRGGG